MGNHILINIREYSIEKVFTDYNYHSKQPRLHLPDKGDYVFFISFDSKEKTHKIVGYFVLEEKYMEKEDIKEAEEWGYYTIQGDPNKSKLIAGLYFNDIMDKFSFKIKPDEYGDITSKRIGEATQNIRILTDEDVNYILELVTKNKKQFYENLSRVYTNVKDLFLKLKEITLSLGNDIREIYYLDGRRMAFHSSGRFFHVVLTQDDIRCALDTLNNNNINDPFKLTHDVPPKWRGKKYEDGEPTSKYFRISKVEQIGDISKIGTPANLVKQAYNCMGQAVSRKNDFNKNTRPVMNSTKKVGLLEGNLEMFIIDQIENIEEGLKVIKRQYHTGVGRIDILCLDQNRNFVVIELKKGQTDDSVIGQISRYIGWIKEHEAKEGQKVRGIIIVGKTDKNLEYATKAHSNLTVKMINVSIG